MTNKVRELGVSSIEEMFDLATYAFNGADTPERRERFRTLAENSWNYGFFDEEDRLTSQVMATPFPVNFYGQEYLMAALAMLLLIQKQGDKAGSIRSWKRSLKIAVIVK